MICPFRIDVEFEYVALESKEGEEPSYLEKAHRQKYPKCVGQECPFYNFNGYCDRVGGE